MLDSYGLRQLTWNLADQAVSDIFVASPMDAQGRGITLSVREGGAAADLTGATAYLVWTHRQAGKRGTTEFAEVDASAGTFAIYYPAAMCEAAGVVDAAILLWLGDNLMVATNYYGGSLIAIDLANIYNANVSAGSTYTAASPLSIDANDEISIDLSAYAALSGATFTGAVTGIAPTSNMHFATKKYVDDAIDALDDLEGMSF